MLTDLLWSLILLSFILPGFAHPYLALSGVIFVDLVKPQTLSVSFLAGKPISLIITLCFFFSLLINIKKISIPKRKMATFLVILFMIWITFTTTQAVYQNIAWYKHDYVIKTLLFSLFIPYVIDSRIKAETFLAILMLSITYYAIVVGLKTATGGGGYNQQFFLSSQRNAGMSESSLLSMVAVMNIPMIYYLTKKSLFIKEIRFLPKLSAFLYFTSVFTVIGTFARTGLVGLGVLGVLVMKNVKNKFRYMFVIFLLITLALPFTPQSWLDRMSTIGSSTQESSAYGRIVVWKWTLDYIKENPIYGGGFHAYLENAGKLEPYIENEDMFITRIQTGKDFHNMYFSVAGGQGLVGLAIFLFILFYTYKQCKYVKINSLDGVWTRDYASTVLQMLIIYCVCGMFISIAYYPWPYYLIALSVSLREIYEKEQKLNGP